MTPELTIKWCEVEHSGAIPAYYLVALYRISRGFALAAYTFFYPLTYVVDVQRMDSPWSFYSVGLLAEPRCVVANLARRSSSSAFRPKYLVPTRLYVLYHPHWLNLVAPTLFRSRRRPRRLIEAAVVANVSAAATAHR